ncbi:MAG: HNH endonuclease [Chloroflexi bacterium]|nr:HNH endonuclease [Chloroflexota bacterium]
MSFPRQVATKALLDCARCCCICHKFCGPRMELHHIVAKADGGEDTYDNCIPLCLNCHAEVRAYDPKHPKGRKYTINELRGHRDRWYEKMCLDHMLGLNLAGTDISNEVARVLATRFDLDEYLVRMIYSNVEGDCSNFVAGNISARELVEHFASRGRLPQLVEYCKQLRPDIFWDGVIRAGQGIQLDQFSSDVLGTRIYRPPLFSKISMGSPFLWLHAIDKNNSQRSFKGPRAHPLTPDFGARFEFDITNPNEMDLRLGDFWIRLVEFVDVDFVDIWARGMGGGHQLRKFDCELEPQAGDYRCSKISEGFDYIRLSFGEMEAFSIEIAVKAQGLYRFTIGTEYSVGGQVEKIESENIIELGFFDSSQHQVRRTHAPLEDYERM